MRTLEGNDSSSSLYGTSTEVSVLMSSSPIFDGRKKTL